MDPLGTYRAGVVCTAAAVDRAAAIYTAAAVFTAVGVHMTVPEYSAAAISYFGSSRVGFIS